MELTGIAGALEEPPHRNEWSGMQDLDASPFSVHLLFQLREQWYPQSWPLCRCEFVCSCMCVCLGRWHTVDGQMSLSSLMNSHLVYECMILTNPFKTSVPLRTQVVCSRWGTTHFSQVTSGNPYIRILEIKELEKADLLCFSCLLPDTRYRPMTCLCFIFSPGQI